MESTTNPAQARSIWAIIGDVFLAPTRAFESFREKPNLWVPLILVTLFFAVFTYVTHGFEQQAALDIYNAAQNLSPQARAQIEAQSQSSPLISSLSMVVIFPIITLCGSLIAWLFISFFFGRKAKFTKVWSTNLLAGLILVLGTWVSYPLMLAKGSIYVSLGPAALMSGSDFTSYFFTALTQVDVFSIWWVIVAGIGYSVVFEISRAKGMTISVVLWIIGILLAMSRTFFYGFAGVSTSFF